MKWKVVPKEQRVCPHCGGEIEVQSYGVGGAQERLVRMRCVGGCFVFNFNTGFYEHGVPAGKSLTEQQKDHHDGNQYSQYVDLNEVADLLKQGKKPFEIAKELGISSERFLKGYTKYLPQIRRIIQSGSSQSESVKF